MNQQIQKKWGITSSTLKCIAIVSMLIDHIGVGIYLYLPGSTIEIYRCLRGIGRLAFPIYCFLLVEGFFHTKNIKKYIGRCAIFALISEVPFDMMVTGKWWSMDLQNIYFTLTLGLCVLYGLERLKGFTLKKILGQIAIIALGTGVAQVLDFDYHYMGVLFIVMFYYCRDFDAWMRDMVGCCVFLYEIPAPLAFIPIHLYHGEKGWNIKYLFYWVYPVHLLIFGLIRMYVL